MSSFLHPLEFCCEQFAQKERAYCMHTKTYAATDSKIQRNFPNNCQIKQSVILRETIKNKGSSWSWSNQLALVHISIPLSYQQMAKHIHENDHRIGQAIHQHQQFNKHVTDLKTMLAYQNIIKQLPWTNSISLCKSDSSGYISLP